MIRRRGGWEREQDPIQHLPLLTFSFYPPKSQKKAFLRFVGRGVDIYIGIYIYIYIICLLKILCRVAAGYREMAWIWTWGLQSPIIHWATVYVRYLPTTSQEAIPSPNQSFIARPKNAPPDLKTGFAQRLRLKKWLMLGIRREENSPPPVYLVLCRCLSCQTQSPRGIGAV